MTLTPRTCHCEFCNDKFSPRAQVKNPRACNKRSCQNKRQRSNEKQWHSQNPEGADSMYHRVTKLTRIRELRKISQKIAELLITGARFAGYHMESFHFQSFVFEFFKHLGIRKVNKFWNFEIFLSGPPVAWSSA